MTNKTKDAIKTTFMELLNRKPLNKITVREIVSGCGINRNTFYYHYTDIRTLVEEIFDEQSSYILRTVEGKSVYECLTTAISFALENKSAMLHIYTFSVPQSKRFRVIYESSPCLTICAQRTRKPSCSTTRAFSRGLRSTG